MEFLEDAVKAISSLITGEQGTKGEWDKENRYMSFVQERKNCHAKWYVDGKDYFYAVSEALMSAKEEILIEDLWLSPELYLRRPPAKNEEYRLDRLLKKKAEEGVKIYVVVYKEVPKTSTYDSWHSKTTLQSLHKNILVQRHPNHLINGTLLWTHHEKIIVVDRHTSFIGGLDLCFGRYDTSTHQLADFHEYSKHYSIWPGQDYSNPRIKDFFDVKFWARTIIDKKQFGRMPWHDVSIGFVGKPTLDIVRHFVQRWNFIKKNKAEDRPEYPVLIAKSDKQYDREHPPQVKHYSYGNGQTISCHPDEGTCDVQIVRSSSIWSIGLNEVEHSIQNAYVKIIEESQHFIYIENQFFVTATKESDNYPVKNLIGKAIVDRIIRAYKNNEQFRIIVSMPLLPAYESEFDSSDVTSNVGTIRTIVHYQLKSICRGGYSIFEVLKQNGVTNPEKYLGFYALRTFDKINPKSVEKGLGVLNDEIEFGRNPVVAETADKNPSGNYITEEVYIHSKLLIADDRIVICGSANLNERSQNGDFDSEIAAVIEDREYIDSKMAGKDWKAGKFAATLRRHIFKEHLGLFNETDHEKVNTFCYPPPIPVDYQELSKEDYIVQDPVSDEFYYKHWHQTATINTEAFRTVFRCVPDDNLTSWDDFKTFVPDRSKIPAGHVHNHKLTNEEIEAELSKVKGHLVHYPLQFMNKEKLSGSFTLDSMAPTEVYI
ncbi:uncharacterized protein OCT59_028117 [Rhizophagus irregularis]|uniref:phospholipase D n=2 Tax=Rhizophagus irregularis TaxID=588596 RepID=A0A015IKR9_RHIIW|nr:hypothetical protein GLOIN_2v1448283 [Rhizophagus irregularis DAOM 181602=DAOM 197198]EXX54735.1 phospholipase D [Rhizophagus irregularis DAOM 197198w]POG81036.1 hypothetical protein GLOIN_2v1448283 [Rhizophagus irregularis DAOM 181602=DAOM 197198]UZO07845.1 hypothetical protein OCT59_028117 [Rhizophagus irregularis]GBC43273.1 phospholipase D/nuclease [Rhizophagus irregularis DAOM 181602=DAOM 197198]|eukprot:XP_025187902.1 hypothetical protein GLOIN_2v1448283 [Rhizophagus irregularis DAOM 181602=DAOM 197198]